jgi:PPOX class probable FMN-dependent enzyme
MVCRKVIHRLDEHCRTLIAHAPFVALATSGASGDCDVSLRGDAPGFVLVLDERRLVIPDRPGNRRLDNMQNILENPHVGLLFIIPGLEETLRVNGRTWITRDEEILGRMAVGAKRPILGIAVEVDECFNPLRQGLQALRPLGAVALAEPLGPALDRADPRRPAAHPPASPPTRSIGPCRRATRPRSTD